MNPRPIIFLSAVSHEFKKARQRVADIIESFGIGVETMEIFNAPAGDLRQVLRDKVNRCQGVIHFVGQHYGFEPPAHDDPLDPCSYTQLEARCGLKGGLKVWLLIFDAAYPPDNPCTDGPRESDLQRTWHHRIRGCGHVYDGIADDKDVEIRALRIAHEINKIFGVAPNTEDKLAILTAKLEQALAQLPQAKSEAVQAAPQDDPVAIEKRAYETLEQKLGLRPGILATELPQLAERILKAPDTSRIERARALYAEKKYDDAEREALEAKADALTGPGFSAREAREALELAADCASAGFHYPRATEHLRAAFAMADENREPAEWARIADRLAVVLDDDGKYGEAAAILPRVIAVRERVLGAEHPDTLQSRNNLAIALRAQGKHAEAEAEHRAVLALRGRVLGAEHPDTLASRNNLAIALRAQGKPAEAEAEHRAVLAVRGRVLGAEHPDTLQSRNNLAVALDVQRKHAEAEAEYRAVLAIRERLLGAEHPTVALSCYNLARCLESQAEGKEAEARKAEALSLARRALAVRKKVLGDEHPDTRDAQELVLGLEKP